MIIPKRILIDVGLEISRTDRMIDSRNATPHSSYIWKRYAIEDYWLFDGDKHTGIVVNTISRLPLPQANNLTPKRIRLKHPVFSITFYCSFNDNTQVIHLIDMPKLEQAKKLAEWYYKEWLKVNER